VSQHGAIAREVAAVVPMLDIRGGSRSHNDRCELRFLVRQCVEVVATAGAFERPTQQAFASERIPCASSFITQDSRLSQLHHRVAALSHQSEFAVCGRLFCLV
jgi:hypothetical protein